MGQRKIEASQDGQIVTPLNRYQHNASSSGAGMHGLQQLFHWKGCDSVPIAMRWEELTSNRWRPMTCMRE